MDRYPYIAIDTDYPGVVLEPGENVSNMVEFDYQAMKGNVDIMHLIELGITFMDELDNLPECGVTGTACVWQFNFKEFSPKQDIYNYASL